MSAIIDVGDPAGQPVIYLHGWPGSRLEAQIAAPSAAALGVRLIAVDRPGIGACPPDAGFRIVDWPARVAALADQLGIVHFAVLGVSGGAPFALACAALIPGRVQRVVLACPALPYGQLAAQIGPPFRQMDWLHAHSPWLLRVGLVAAGFACRHLPDGMSLPTPRALFPDADRAVFTDPHVRRWIVPSIREAWRQGGAQVLREGELLRGDWGFEPAAIDVPVHVLHGSADRVIPCRASEAFFARVPAARFDVVAGQGHFSLPFAQARRLLEACARTA